MNAQSVQVLEQPPIALEAGKPHTFHLAPFEVLTLEADPQM